MTSHIIHYLTKLHCLCLCLRGDIEDMMGFRVCINAIVDRLNLRRLIWSELTVAVQSYRHAQRIVLPVGKVIRGSSGGDVNSRVSISVDFWRPFSPLSSTRSTSNVSRPWCLTVSWRLGPACLTGKAVPLHSTDLWFPWQPRDSMRGDAHACSQWHGCDTQKVTRIRMASNSDWARI